MTLESLLSNCFSSAMIATRCKYSALSTMHPPPLQGLEPLRYQWYKDDRKLTMATSDSPTLIIPEVAALDAGQYHCQVCEGGGAYGGCCQVCEGGGLRWVLNCGLGAPGQQQGRVCELGQGSAQDRADVPVGEGRGEPPLWDRDRRIIQPPSSYQNS